MKKALWFLIMGILVVFVCAATVLADGTDKFTDVPEDDWAKEYIYKLKELNITTGKGKGLFGYNENITRAEFLTFLVRTLEVETENVQQTGVFSDVKPFDWYASYVYAGLEHSIIDADEYEDGKFEPNKFITREEMAVMIVRALGYEYMARMMNDGQSYFTDVENHKGHIAIAKDLGIIKGKTGELFAPYDYALRQEAAAMLIRMYGILHHELGSLNAFYAIRSFPQIDKMAVFDTVSFGWGRLEYNKKTEQVELETQPPAPNHPFYIPEGHREVMKRADQQKVKKYFMVFGTNADIVDSDEQQVGVVSHLLRNEQAMQEFVQTVTNQVYQVNRKEVEFDFDGVVIDFEELRDQEQDKEKFVSFLTTLNHELDKAGKDLVVCVHPKRASGYAYFDGYNYKAIGQLADKVILMAHDYAPYRLKSEEIYSFTGDTPLAPIKEIYDALRYAIDEENGIPKDKLLLQLSFNAIQWQFEDGKLKSDSAANPTYDMLRERMKDSDIEDKEIHYSDISQSPYFIYVDGRTNVRNIIWYEDTRSIQAKVRLAKMFGINGISVWRLGQVPDYKDDGTNRLYLDIWPILKGIKEDMSITNGIDEY